MSRTIMLIPVGAGVGLTSVSLGVLRAMERKGVRVSFFKPIAQPRQGGDQPDLTTTIIRANSDMQIAESFSMASAEELIRNDQTDVLLEDIVARFKAETLSEFFLHSSRIFQQANALGLPLQQVPTWRWSMLIDPFPDLLSRLL